MTQGLTGIQLALFEDEVQLLETAKKKTCTLSSIGRKIANTNRSSVGAG